MMNRFIPLLAVFAAAAAPTGVLARCAVSDAAKMGAEMTLAGFGASGYPRANVRVDAGVTVSGLYSTGNELDSTSFGCRREDGRISFRFLVDDKTPCAAAERGLPKRTLESYDRVEVFLSPVRDMSRPYCCIEVGLEGDVLDYRAVYYRKMDYEFSLKTLKVRTGRTGGRHEVGFSLSVRELEKLGIDPENFHMGVFRADFAPGGKLVDWYSAMPQGYGEPDFHRPCHLFKVKIPGDRRF